MEQMALRNKELADRVKERLKVDPNKKLITDKPTAGSKKQGPKPDPRIEDGEEKVNQNLEARTKQLQQEIKNRGTEIDKLQTNLDKLEQQRQAREELVKRTEEENERLRRELQRGNIGGEELKKRIS